MKGCIICQKRLKKRKRKNLTGLKRKTKTALTRRRVRIDFLLTDPYNFLHG